MPDWLDAMLACFDDSEIVGAKGIYRTHQKSLAARFVQIEYEDKYRLMAGPPASTSSIPTPPGLFAIASRR